jgi:hypothetical protein
MGVFHLFVHPRIVGPAPQPSTELAARASGFISLALWVGVITFGRWIGFTTN